MSKKYIPWICAAGIAVFAAAAQVESVYVLALYERPVPWFRDLMEQSLYEGGLPGGSDIGVTAAILCFVEWVARLRGKKPFTRLTLAQLKFVWLSGLLTALVAVHSLKWIISRARPKMILTPDFLAQEGSARLVEAMTWPGFMPWNGPRGYSFNSFPSGHAASCAILLVFAYLLGQRGRWLGVSCFLVVTLYCIMMVVARSMAGMHWLSDGVASYFICWVIVHIMSRKSLGDPS